MTALLALLLIASGVDVDLTPGFRSRAFPDSWGRITATVRADAEGFTGELRMAVHGAGTGRYRRSITLGPNGRKRFRWDLFLSGWEDRAEVELIDRDGGQVARKEVQITFVDDQEIRTVIAGETPCSLGLVQKPLRIAPLWIGAEWMPDDLLPLLAADVVIVTEPEKLEWGQEEALREWTEAGGRLVVYSTKSVGLFRQGFWRDILPLEVAGTGTFPIETEEGSFSLPIVEGSVKAGRPFLPLAGRDLGVRSRIGRGEVIFLRYPAGVDRLQEVLPTLPMWRAVLDLEEVDWSEWVRRRKRRDPLFAGTVGIFQGFAPKATGPGLVGAVMGLVIVLGYVVVLTLWSVRRFRPRRGGEVRRASISFISVTAACSAGLLLFGHLFAPPSISLHHAVFADAGVTRTFSRIRGGEGRTHVFRAEGVLSGAEWMPLWEGTLDAGWSWSPPSGLHLPVAVRSDGVFVGCRVSKEGGLGISCTWEDRLTGTVRLANGGDVDLTGCLLVDGSLVRFLPDLPAGSDIVVDLRSAPAIRFQDWVVDLEDRTRRGWWWHVNPGVNWSWRSPKEGLLALSFFRRCREITSPDDLYLVRQRGIDLSGALDRGASVFAGLFDEGVTGIEADTGVEEETVGVVRCILEP